MMKPVKYAIYLLSGLFLFAACGGGESEDAATSGGKEKQIRQYNLEMEKKQAASRTPCDTIALKEYILRTYPPGTFLVTFSETTTFNIPRAAVIYYKGDQNYIFAVIAKSKPGERHIEVKNIVGYESSFINLDSTKLGTAFFYLTLFTCEGEGNFNLIWETEVPIHGGFNSMTVRNWKTKNVMYIELNYIDGIISGNRNYNFFLVKGIRNKPHLIETYEGLTMKRTMLDVNKDIYPDYKEFIFVDSTRYILKVDSVTFYWDTTKQLYVTDRNKRWFRKY